MMKRKISFRRTAAFLLSLALLLGVPASGVCAAAEAPAPQQEAALTGDTLGGASTFLDPSEPYYLVDDELGEENGLFSSLFGRGGFTVGYLNVKGAGLKHNYRVDLLDCLVGITYTEMGGIVNKPGISLAAAREAWRAQAIAIHSYLEYHNKHGAANTALTYTPVSQIPATTRNRMYDAIRPVANLILITGNVGFGGSYQVCNAVFSASAGYNPDTGVYGTCDAKDAWGNSVSYLKSVESRWEEKYHNILIGHKNYVWREYTDSRHPDEPLWCADTSQKDLGGFVKYNTLMVNGRHYNSISGYVSSRYCFSYGQDEDGRNVMTYYGWGHGVGMSQCGAIGYAQEEGLSYDQILGIYYQGVSLLDLGSQSVSGTGTVSGGGDSLLSGFFHAIWMALAAFFG